MLLKKAKQNPLFLVIAGVILVAVLAFAWWTISPFFIRTTLVEGQNIPVPAANTNADSNSGAAVSESAESPAKSSDTMAEGAGSTEKTPEVIPGVADSSGNTAGVTEEATVETMEKAPAMEATPEAGMETPAGESMTEVESTEPVVFASGNFDHKDSVHYADGQAILARDAEGNNVVRLQDLNSVNGPDLYVYVSEHPNPNTSDELHMGEFNLGSLKATNGSFSYTLDPSIDVSKIKSVVIYCKAFSVIFSTAALQAAQ